MGENILEKVKQLETLFSKYEITGRELMQVRTLAEKIEKQEMTVSVIGQFKRGKSTLVNGILGDKVMPVGIVPAVKLARVSLPLSPGDTIILMSDGIYDSGRRSWVGRYLTSLIYDEIESGRQYGPRQLADRILTEAVRQGKGRTADDATVAVMRLR